MVPIAAITPSFLSDFDSCVTNGLAVDVFSVEVIFSVDVVGVSVVDVRFSVDDVIVSVVSGNTVVDVVIFSVDVVGVTVVDVNFSVVDVVGSVWVVILPVVDISSIDECVASGNVVIISVDEDVVGNIVLCVVVVVCSSVCVVINSSVVSDKVLVGSVVHNVVRLTSLVFADDDVVVIALISNLKNKN